MEGVSKNVEYKKGLWTAEEDKILMDYVGVHGKGRWNRIAKLTGLRRRGKSCRLRWMNYLSPGVKRDEFSEEEEDLIIRLHKLLGNRWSLIAGRVPGRTDNQVKNHWNTHLSKKLGISKEKRRVGRYSRSRSSQVREKESLITPPLELQPESSAKLLNEHKNNDDLESARRLMGTHEFSLVNGSSSCPFWFSSESLGPDTPSLVDQLVDDHFFNFLWD